MIKTGIIYKVVNLVNNKIYIGQTINSLKARKGYLTIGGWSLIKTIR